MKTAHRKSFCKLFFVHFKCSILSAFVRSNAVITVTAESTPTAPCIRFSGIPITAASGLPTINSHSYTKYPNAIKTSAATALTARPRNARCRNAAATSAAISAIIPFTANVPGANTAYPAIISASAEPKPAAANPHAPPQTQPAISTKQSPRLTYPRVSVGICISIVAAQISAANTAAVIVFLKFSFITVTLSVSLSFLYAYFVTNYNTSLLDCQQFFASSRKKSPKRCRGL